MWSVGVLDRQEVVEDEEKERIGDLLPLERVRKEVVGWMGALGVDYLIESKQTGYQVSRRQDCLEHANLVEIVDE